MLFVSLFIISLWSLFLTSIAKFVCCLVLLLVVFVLLLFLLFSIFLIFLSVLIDVV